MKYDVIVIGAGPGGMFAALTAAQNKKTVAIIEKNQRVGRKLMITGKGRCNITNACDCATMLKNIPTNSKFLYSAFSQFSSDDVIRFFSENGVPTKIERGGRVFPVSDKAVDVVDALVNKLKSSNVKIITDTVTTILVDEQKITGVCCLRCGDVSADSVVLATGGKSYPLTGSTGDGYKFAQEVGHTVTNIVPSLVGIVTNDDMCHNLQGLSLKNIRLSCVDKVKNKEIFSDIGEMLFTHFGISGPLCLSLSAHLRPFEAARYIAVLDMKPGLSHQQLDARIIRDFEKFSNKDISNALGELLPRKIIPTMLMLAKIPPFEKVNQVSKEQRKNLCEAVKCIKIDIDGFSPIEEAIITSGGINVKEINPKTMESKLVSGLYFAGEVIDVDGYTGGFNLQIAFSTGFVAGMNC
ncbi:MAG: NAD(P)/FAD-dependent oxidoreductase [Oscillospiraceae bacterium]